MANETPKFTHVQPNGRAAFSFGAMMVNGQYAGPTHITLSKAAIENELDGFYSIDMDKLAISTRKKIGQLETALGAFK